MSEVRTEAPSFFERYSRGECSADDTDDFVDRWHDAYKGRTEYPPLHEYLGLTGQEYEILLGDPYSLPRILEARQSSRSLIDIMAEHFVQLRAANRPEDASIIYSLDHWLRTKGRL